MRRRDSFWAIARLPSLRGNLWLIGPASLIILRGVSGIGFVRLRPYSSFTLNTKGGGDYNSFLYSNTVFWLIHYGLSLIDGFIMILFLIHFINILLLLIINDLFYYWYSSFTISTPNKIFWLFLYLNAEKNPYLIKFNILIKLNLFFISCFRGYRH
jgi:hypothetical protein